MTDSRCTPSETGPFPSLSRRDFGRGLAGALGGAVYSTSDAHTRAGAGATQKPPSTRSSEEITSLGATELSAETGVPRERLLPILDYGGLPLSAQRVVAGVTKQL